MGILYHGLSSNNGTKNAFNPKNEQNFIWIYFPFLKEDATQVHSAEESLTQIQGIHLTKVLPSTRLLVQLIIEESLVTTTQDVLLLQHREHHLVYEKREEFWA